jgi:predicted Zn-dependent protease
LNRSEPQRILENRVVCGTVPAMTSLSRYLSTRTVASAALIVALGGVAPSRAQNRAPTPANFATLSAKADAARDAGRLDDAASLYRQALAVDPTWQDGWWSLGTILYDQDSYPLAARAFRRLLAYDPKNGTAHLMLALCEYQLDRNDSALQHLATAKRLGVKSDQQLVHVLHYHEAMLLLRKGRYEDALAALKALVEDGVESDELDVALGLGVLLIRPKDTPAEGVPERQIVLRAGRAERHRLAQQWDAARAAYGDLVKEFPAFPNIHYAFGRFLLAVEDTDAAIQQFKEEIENNSRHVRARMQIAATYYRVDSAAGIPFAQEVVKLEPGYPFGHYLLGLLYLDTRDLSRSIQELETAARMVPKEPQFQFSLGNAYARAGRPKDAARARAAFARLGGTNSPSGPGSTSEQPRLDLDRTP